MKGNKQKVLYLLPDVSGKLQYKHVAWQQSPVPARAGNKSQFTQECYVPGSRVVSDIPAVSLQNRATQPNQGAT